jgi:hypothetical protein
MARDLFETGTNQPDDMMLDGPDADVPDEPEEAEPESLEPVPHTPGPWYDERKHLLTDVGEGLKIRDAKGNQLVAVVAGPVKVKRSREEWAANAAIVAAAPTLYALAWAVLNDPRASAELKASALEVLRQIDDHPIY